MKPDRDFTLLIVGIVIGIIFCYFFIGEKKQKPHTYLTRYYWNCDSLTKEKFIPKWEFRSLDRRDTIWMIGILEQDLK